MVSQVDITKFFFVTLAFTIVHSITDEYPPMEYLDYLGKKECTEDYISLNFTTTQLTRINKNFLKSNYVTCLDFRGNSISYIEKDAFSNVPNLTTLFISGYELNNPFAFGSHNALKVLIIYLTNTYNNGYNRYNNRYNNDYSTSNIINPYYPNLEMLSLQHYDLRDLYMSKDYMTSVYTYLPITFTTSTPKLQILDLSFNNIDGINFVHLLPETLKHLFLHHNHLNTFAMLEKGIDLITLTLDENKFEKMINYRSSMNNSHYGLWTIGLENLHYLSISGNKIDAVHHTAFSNMRNLTYLNLSRNAISSLYLDTFKGLPLLKTLDLSNNNLNNIVNFSDNTNISSLLLHCNKIEKVAAYAFNHMPNLKELFLSGNSINEIDINGFAYLYQLETLDLSTNQLNSLPEGWADAFSSLKYLNLNENQFISLKHLSLSNKLPIEIIYFMSNPFDYLTVSSLHSMPQNATIIRNVQNKIFKSCSVKITLENDY